MPKSKYSENLEGTRFNRWTIVSFSHSRRESRKGFAFFWLCRCDCETERVVNVRLMFRGKSTSCGCWHSECTALQSFKHGHGKTGKTSPEYRSWDHAIQRCSNPKWNKSWHRYGGRGIQTCEGFRNFSTFLSIVGLKPTPKHSIDRVNNNGNYSCGACAQCLTENWPMNLRWATALEQAANTCRSPKYANL